MKLRLFLFVSLTITALIPVLVYGVWPQSRAFDKEVADVSERHLLLAQNIGVALERYDRDIKATFNTLTTNLIHGSHLFSTHEMLTNLNFRHICVATIPDGLITGELSNDAVPCPDRVPPALFREFMETATADVARFTEVMPGPDGKPMMYVLRIVGDKLAIGGITTKYFVDLGEAIAFGKRGHAAIVDHMGNVLAHPLPAWRAAMKNIAQVAPVRRMMNRETGVATFYSPALKGDMIAGFTWVPGANWGVMIPQPVSELRERADIVQKYATTVIIFGLAVAGLASWVLSGHLTRPVLAVVDAAREVAAGKHQVRVETEKRAIPQEFRMLTQSFNAMAESLDQFANTRNAALTEAESANRAKTEFLSNMSHELRTPLNAIIGFTDIMREKIFGELGHPRYAEYAEDISHSGRHLLSIINELLDLSKIDAGQTVLDEHPFDIGRTLKSCAQMVARGETGPEDRIRVDTAEHLPRFNGDERLIKQIILNLLSNSDKFTPEGGQINASAKVADNGGINIHIHDTGCGIATNDIDSVLEPFGQVRSDRHHTNEGTGLGLPISRGLTELHGGEFTLESELNAGTSVTLSFPPERTITA